MIQDNDQTLHGGALDHLYPQSKELIRNCFKFFTDKTFRTFKTPQQTLKETENPQNYKILALTYRSYAQTKESTSAACLELNQAAPSFAKIKKKNKNK